MKQKLKNSKEESEVKKTLKGNKGITLIALVITIIVLLILAGVTIAMLSGENGILSRATETRSTNAEAQADEQAKLAYMGVKTEIIAEKVSNASYNAQSNAGKLGKKVKQDLKGNEWTISPDGTDETVQGEKITMTFTDSSLNNTNEKAIATNKIVYTIELPGAGETTVTLKKDGTEMTSGNSGGSEKTTSSVVFKDGETTVTTPAVGNDVEIGAEKFKVIKITGNKVTAMPYYNLDLTGTDIKQQTSGDTAYSTGQTVAFSSVASATWKANENITLGANESEITTPIANYQTYLRGLGASNVETKIGRYYEVGHAGATITEAEYIGNLSGLNPGSAGRFWLGSSGSGYGYPVCLVSNNGSFSSNSFRRADDYGVRPVIIITISGS